MENKIKIIQPRKIQDLTSCLSSSGLNNIKQGSIALVQSVPNCKKYELEELVKFAMKGIRKINPSKIEYSKKIFLRPRYKNDFHVDYEESEMNNFPYKVRKKLGHVDNLVHRFELKFPLIPQIGKSTSNLLIELDKIYKYRDFTRIDSYEHEIQLEKNEMNEKGINFCYDLISIERLRKREKKENAIIYGNDVHYFNGGTYFSLTLWKDNPSDNGETFLVAFADKTKNVFENIFNILRKKIKVPL